MYTRCRKWRRERRVLQRELQVLEIEWQHRPERRWVANLGANEQAVRPLLKYLMTSEVGGQEGGSEKAAEWGQGVDQEGGSCVRKRIRVRRASSFPKTNHQQSSAGGETTQK